MNIKVIVNDYILIWNLLFRASISDTVHKLKQKIWINYKNEYNNIYKDKTLMLKDIKNYIPNDDTIYNIVLESKDYQKLKKETEKYRLEVLKLWNKKLTTSLGKILKKELQEYTIFIVNERFDILEVNKVNDQMTLILGKKINKKDSYKLIIDMLTILISNEIKPYKGSNRLIADAVIELATYNELATNLTDNSHYFMGSESLVFIKRQLYPYWLMYLGVDIKRMKEYMLRDKIAFDMDKYPYKEELKDYTLEEFIDFCISHKRYMIKEEKVEKVEVI